MKEGGGMSGEETKTRQDAVCMIKDKQNPAACRYVHLELKSREMRDKNVLKGK